MQKAKDASTQSKLMKQFDKTQTMVEKMVAEGDTPFDFTVFLRIKGDVQQVNEICKDLDDSFVWIGESI